MDEDETAEATSLLRRALLIGAGVLLVLMLAAMQTVHANIEIERDVALPMFFASRQDVPIGAALLALLVGWWLKAGPPAPVRLGVSDRQPVLLLVVMTLAIWALRVWVLADYNLSRDEQMVAFDASIFSRGHLFEAIPPFWRTWYAQLNSTFILPIGDREAWVSAYLPGNAALRALLGFIMPASAIGALFALIGGAALWRIAARLWPECASTRAVVLVLYAVSAQVVLTGTTTFAMSAHLAANLLWLWLFLKRTPLAQAGAILVGFVATGLHQPLFHPLFVAPFLLNLLRERAWKELGAYVVCYGLIGLFWIGWQPWVASHGLHPLPAAVHSDGSNYIDRFRATFHAPNQYSLWVMAANLLRFLTFNAPVLLPLALVTLLTPLRHDRMVQALWLGVLLLVLVMTALLPSQVNGWGYRYLHGFLGSLVLLAGYGWRWLEERAAAPGRAFIATTALALLALLPLRVWLAAGQVNAYAVAAARVRAIPADVVVVDEGVPFAQDLVSNRADLSNRPVLLAHSLPPASLPALCREHTLGFADAPLLGSVSRFFGLAEPTAPTERQQRARAAAAAAGCRIVR